MKMYQVDAFTQALFKGNSAAVLVLDQWLANDVMQNIASENNLSETAFVLPLKQDHYAIRWFSPIKEVDFCGHATLASAFVLFKDFTQSKTINFEVNNLGRFVIHQDEDGKIKMNFPIRRAQVLTEIPTVLLDTLSQPFSAVYLNQQAYIVEYADEKAIDLEQPDAQKLKRLNDYAIEHLGSGRGLALTAQSTDYDCISRYFSPNLNHAEDPVTGSIHTALAPFWMEKLNKKQIVAYQASKRGGVLYCEMLAQNYLEIAGYAKLYMMADIHIGDA